MRSPFYLLCGIVSQKSGALLRLQLHLGEGDGPETRISNLYLHAEGAGHLAPLWGGAVRVSLLPADSASQPWVYTFQGMLLEGPSALLYLSKDGFVSKLYVPAQTALDLSGYLSRAVRIYIDAIEAEHDLLIGTQAALCGGGHAHA